MVGQCENSILPNKYSWRWWWSSNLELSFIVINCEKRCKVKYTSWLEVIARADSTNITVLIYVLSTWLELETANCNFITYSHLT